MKIVHSGNNQGCFWLENKITENQWKIAETIYNNFKWLIFYFFQPCPLAFGLSRKQTSEENSWNQFNNWKTTFLNNMTRGSRGWCSSGVEFTLSYGISAFHPVNFNPAHTEVYIDTTLCDNLQQVCEVFLYVFHSSTTIYLEILNIRVCFFLSD